MMLLVCGGAASGKSAYAERMLCRLSGDAPRVYLATMKPFGDEAASRIARHRAQRAGDGFETRECFLDLSEAAVPPDSAVLLEDIGNLCANELFGRADGGAGTAERIVRGVKALRRKCRCLVVVTNELGSGGTDYAGDTLRYLRVMAEVNRRLAALSDAVCEVACGLAEYYKGEEPA